MFFIQFCLVDRIKVTEKERKLSMQHYNCFLRLVLGESRVKKVLFFSKRKRFVSSVRHISWPDVTHILSVAKDVRKPFELIQPEEARTTL